MSEWLSLLRQAALARARGESVLVATVVAVRGSSYRRPGARMIVASDDSFAGSVSAGCLENDVLTRGRHRLRDGRPVVVTYDSTSDDDEVGWGIGLGCNGVVDVLLETVEPGAPADPCAFLEERLGLEERAVLVTVFRSTRADVPVGARLLMSATGECDSTLPPCEMRGAMRREAATALRWPSGASAVAKDLGEVEALVEVADPPPCLFVCGTSHDALPFVRLARAIGWRTVVGARSASVGLKERFALADEILVASPEAIAQSAAARARPLAVLMSHDYDRDLACLEALLDTRVPYVGVLGPKARRDRMLEDLARRGRVWSPSALAKVHAPVGLDLGAETPAEIALSAVSEMQASLTRASAERLRDRDGPIHSVEAPTHVTAERPVSAAGPRRSVVGVVLAAGGSTRLGRPKQLEPFGGRPLVAHVLAELAASSCDRTAVVLGANAELVSSAVARQRPVRIPNPDWREGIASSIRLAARWAAEQRASALVLVLADQPLLDASHVDRLVGAWQGGARCAGSRYEGVVGVPAVFDESLFADLLDLGGDRGAARVLAAAGAQEIAWPQGKIDVDTEEQATSLRKIKPLKSTLRSAVLRR